MPPTLLLADDSVTIQRVIELTFADEDIRVIAVGDGQQAIDRITADPPDVVLVDTGMPQRDGYEVATFIKQNPALAHIPVVLLTGAFEPVDEDRARQVGCDAVLVKPFEPQVVVKRVRELLGQRLSTVVPATSGPVAVVPPQDTHTDALTPPVEAPRRPAHDSNDTLEAQSRAKIEDPGPGLSPDDPLADYLDRMDEAFDQMDGGSATSGRGREDVELRPPTPKDTPAFEEPKDTPASEEQFDSLEGALSVLEGALDQMGLESPEGQADEAPAGPDVFQSMPDLSPEAPGPAAGSGSAGETPDTTLSWVSDPAVPVMSAAPVAPVAAVAPVVSVPDPTAAPPSLADAFASLLAAEQGGAERAEKLYPWPRPASLQGMHEALIDQVVERVIARLSDGVTGDVVADVVARVAEKLVREELDRRKPV